MAGVGRWSLQTKRKRCSGNRQCSACAANPERAPHGPYYELRRRHPETGVQQSVYLGTTGLTSADLDEINDVFRGEVPPTRSEVFSVVHQSLERRH